MIPEASAGCVCLFSITSTVVLEPREDRHAWGIYSATGADTPVKHMAVNLGAPGDRRDQNGVIWFGYPRPRSAGRLEYMFDLKPKFATGGSFDGGKSESVKVVGTESPWVYASQARGLSRLELKLLGKDDRPARYTVKLHFAASKGDKPGEPMAAEQARAVGLVEQVVPLAALEETALALCRTIAANAPISVRLAKRALNRVNLVELERALALETDGLIETYASDDNEAGAAAFGARQKADFKGE